MKKLLLLIIILSTLASPETVQAQSTFRYGGELGLSISQLPERMSSVTENGQGKRFERTNPLPGPLVGLATELTVKRYIRFTMGAQYQLAGARYYFNQKDKDYHTKKNYSYEYWENKTMHKLSFPVSAGFVLSEWKLQPSLFVGYRPNYFIKGEESGRSIFVQESQETRRGENSFDPFDTFSSARRFQHQVFAGFSSSIGEHIKVSFTYHAGGQLHYGEHNATSYYYTYNNNDWIISATYLLRAKKKDQETE